MNDIMLSVDCSNKWTCLGLACKGELFAEINSDLGRKQASKLPLLVDELLNRKGVKLSDVSCVAVTVGPGYFTGIRIGMAYAAALAYALDVEVVPLSSLEVLLRTVPDWKCDSKAALIAASRELAFCALWHNGQLILSEKERRRDELLSECAAQKLDCEFWAVDDARLFASTDRSGIHFLPCPSGAAAALLAWENRQNSIKPDSLRARYLREPGLGRSL